MYRSRVGCLTSSALLTGLLTLMLIGGVWLWRGGSMFSPGDLNAVTGKVSLGGVYSHAETQGKCSACHTAPFNRLSMDDRCLTCHDAVASQISQDGTMHFVMLAARKGEYSCRDCHTEHHGAKAGLTLLDLTTFPHEQLPFSLQAHQKKTDETPFACSDCHGEDITTFDSQTCLTCHQELDQGKMEAHLAAFGADCLACHDGLETYGSQFDHNLFAFPLTGKHTSLDCAGCHAGMTSIPALQATQQTCIDCHAADDPHAGQLGSQCADCHTPEGWEQVTFDHASTAYPLIGKHLQAGCRDCHVDLVFVGTPQECAACHLKEDAHSGRFGSNCGNCHTPAGWLPATFDHTLGAFQLTGAHLSVECSLCHVNDVFQGTPTDCVACHAEPVFHFGLLGTACQDCHNTTAWQPALFNGSHLFPFAHGAGAASSCMTCHPDSLATYTCYGCHDHTPGAIADKHLGEGISNFDNCVECHPTGLKEEGEGGGGGDD